MSWAVMRILLPAVRTLISDVDELGRYANLVTRGAHASFQDVIHPKRFANLAGVYVLIPEGEDISAWNDFQAADLGEVGNDVLRNAGTEVVALFVIVDI